MSAPLKVPPNSPWAIYAHVNEHYDVDKPWPVSVTHDFNHPERCPKERVE